MRIRETRKRPARMALTWVSVSIKLVATSKRLGRDRYLLALNWFSSSSNCCEVNAVLGRRVLSSTWAPIGAGGTVTLVIGSGNWGSLV